MFFPIANNFKFQIKTFQKTPLCFWGTFSAASTRPAPAKRQQLAEIEHRIYIQPHYFMPYGQFYALAIFIMDRLDTKGVGLKPWGRQRACSQDYPMALDPLLQWEQKPVHDFLFSFQIPGQL